MSDRSKQPADAVVVAVGTGGADAAITFAVEEAKRCARPVHLIHVIAVPTYEAYDDIHRAFLNAGAAMLEAALEHARAQAGEEVPVTGEIVEHHRVTTTIVHRADRARLAVLQHRHLGRVHRVLVGSVASGVAARAAVPVVSVPERWSRLLDGGGIVTVGVQDPAEAEPLLRQAFKEARARGGRVEVLHAWWLAHGFDLTSDPEVVSDWKRRAETELRPHVEAVHSRYADVPMTVRVSHAPPAEALLRAAAESDLLVVGRRHHRLPNRSHLGPVARAVLATSPVPVLVAPDEPARGALAEGSDATSEGGRD